jgi:2-(3-amino-3-carboxypropyl)histidine synthase
MKKTTINEIEQVYDLEINRIINVVKKEKAKRVLLQFPEGVKQYSGEILKEIESKADCNCFIWLDSCFGACDLPVEVEKLGIDLIIQFGHSNWSYSKNKTIQEL